MLSRRRAARSRLLPAAVAALLALGSCTGDSPSDPNDPDPTPSISITLGSSTLTLQQGDDGTVQVTVSRAGGYTGAVSVSVDGLPSGVTASSGQIASGSNSTTLDIAAAAGAAVGSASATVRATGAGVAAATAGLSIQVTAAPTGGFALSLDPASLSLQQGASGESAVSITRTAPFDGGVTLAASAPSGITVGVPAGAVGGDAATMSVEVAGSVDPGTYPVTVTGSGAGVSDDVATLQLTVTAAPAGSDFAWGFCDDDPPIWMAAQDGSGSWQRVLPSGEVFPFTVSSDRVQVAAVWDRGGEYELVVFFLARPEASLTEGVCPTYRDVNGTVVGLAAGQLAFATLGYSAASAFGGVSNALAFNDVVEGAVDFFATRSSSSGGTQVVDRLFLQRDVNPAPGATVTVDFTGPNAFAPAVVDVTASNLGGDVGAPLSTIVTPTMASSIFSGATSTGGPSWAVPVVPQDRLRSGDIQSVGVTALTGPLVLTNNRSTVKWFSTVADQTLTLGPYLSPVTVSAPTSAPYARLRVQYDRQPEYMGHVQAAFNQSDRSVILWATDDWLGGASAADLAIPDFAGVDGWMDIWGPRAGSSATWIVSVNGWDGIGGIIGPDRFIDGLEVRTAVRIGSITP